MLAQPLQLQHQQFQGVIRVAVLHIDSEKNAIGWPWQKAPTSLGAPRGGGRVRPRLRSTRELVVHSRPHVGHVPLEEAVVRHRLARGVEEGRVGPQRHLQDVGSTRKRRFAGVPSALSRFRGRSDSAHLGQSLLQRGQVHVFHSGVPQVADSAIPSGWPHKVQAQRSSIPIQTAPYARTMGGLG